MTPALKHNKKQRTYQMLARDAGVCFLCVCVSVCVFVYVFDIFMMCVYVFDIFL